MNHRDLVLSADRKSRLAFLKLPRELQDEIMDALDSGRLTLRAASERLKSRGYSLSHEAVAAYHRTVRRERRLREAQSDVARVLEGFRDYPQEEMLKALANLVAALAIAGLVEGTVGIRDVDIARVIAASGGSLTVAKSDGDESPVAVAAAGLSPEAADSILRRILGSRT